MTTITAVHQAQSGDKAAFIRLCRQIEPEMYGMARSMLHRDEDCADVMQEATLKAYRSIRSLRQPEYFKTWMLRIIINECRLLQRRQKNTVEAGEAVNQLPSPSSSAEYEKIELREAVEQLDEKLRAVVALHYFQDMPIRQIAELLGITETAVKSRLYRARKTLMQGM
ncbi:RNA polymerase sigma factor [Paenibacillus donghaensis]|uniref:RNA polymerase n=1 Tax=Paenibacillus donghaensis TaxID=414771 RepID=A0A2Z2KBR0_9BACL|nr:sigma-70 family RNA polymerase sigma factor [Paenibacillus donghaensis]ASA24146.1 RNA polymerase [Paenibacillus donghaensis]